MPKYYFNITLKVRRLENGMLLPVVAAKGKTQFANVAAFFFLTFFKTPLTPPPPSLWTFGRKQGDLFGYYFIVERFVLFPKRRLVKKRIFYGQADRKRWLPLPFTISFLWFFCWCSFDLIICVRKRILHKKKSISMQLLESPIPPLTAGALRMTICKRPVPSDHHLKEDGPSVW